MTRGAAADGVAAMPSYWRKTRPLRMAPIMALAIVGMPLDKLPIDYIEKRNAIVDAVIDRLTSEGAQIDRTDGVLCALGIHGQWIYIDYDAGMVAVKQSSQPVPADEALDNLTYAMFQAIADELK